MKADSASIPLPVKGNHAPAMGAALQAAGIERGTLKLKKHTPPRPKPEPAKVLTGEERAARHNARQEKARQESIKAAKRFLMTFAVFNRSPVPPLMLGVDRVLNVRYDDLANPKFGRNHLKIALARIIQSGNYRKRLIEGADRYNLEGEPVDSVTASQVAKGEVQS